MTGETWNAIKICFGISKAWLIEHGLALTEADESRLMGALADHITIYGDHSLARDLIISLVSEDGKSLDSLLTELKRRGLHGALHKLDAIEEDEKQKREGP